MIRTLKNLVVVKQNDNEVAESKIMIFGSIAITTNLTITKNLFPVLG
jgi:hypothetical protein